MSDAWGVVMGLLVLAVPLVLAWWLVGRDSRVAGHGAPKASAGRSRDKERKVG